MRIRIEVPFASAAPAKALKSAEAEEKVENEPPSAKAKKPIELTAEQAKALGIDF